jgi:hypothetical protein
MKKFISLNRTEQADYLIAKLSNKDTAALGAQELHDVTPVVVAQVLSAVTNAFESWREVQEYFHGKYGFGEDDKKDSVPPS